MVGKQQDGTLRQACDKSGDIHKRNVASVVVPCGTAFAKCFCFNFQIVIRCIRENIQRDNGKRNGANIPADARSAADCDYPFFTAQEPLTGSLFIEYWRSVPALVTAVTGRPLRKPPYAAPALRMREPLSVSKAMKPTSMLIIAENAKKVNRVALLIFRDGGRRCGAGGKRRCILAKLLAI